MLDCTLLCVDEMSKYRFRPLFSLRGCWCAKPFAVLVALLNYGPTCNAFVKTLWMTIALNFCKACTWSLFYPCLCWDVIVKTKCCPHLLRNRDQGITLRDVHWWCSRALVWEIRDGSVNIFMGMWLRRQSWSMALLILQRRSRPGDHILE